MATRKSNYTSDQVPVKSITNGAIILDDGLKVTGVKIMPRNIFILDYDMQNAIISNLKNVYNVIDYEFWIIAADRPVDINLYLSQLQVLYNQTQDFEEVSSIKGTWFLGFNKNRFESIKTKIQNNISDLEKGPNENE